VPGGTALEKRSGLRRAVELLEAHAAEVVVVASFDRLVRSLAMQREVVERIENAGGAIVAVEVGELRADTASRWLSSTMLGMVAEYHRRVTAERTQDAKRRAVARGVPPFPNVPPGYRRGTDGRIEPHPDQAPIVAEAFRLRARGATVVQVRDYLRAHGIQRSFHGTQSLLGSRVVLGELRFGDMVNPTSHAAIVEPDVWQAVQRTRASRGRRAKSDRLLARLGVLRCGSCGARMVIGTQTQQGRDYPFYRCPPVGDCSRRVTVSAQLVERIVVDVVKNLLADVRGNASLVGGAEDAEREFEEADRELTAAIQAFTGLEDVPAARERLLGLRERREQARDRLNDLQAGAAAALTTDVGDWDLLTQEERRALVVAVIDRTEVRPGRGPERITVHTRAE